jgi:hypothetical protein
LLSTMVPVGLTVAAADAAYVPGPKEVKIASNYVHADGCGDTTQSFTTGIPNSANLDTSYQGVLSGIKLVETTGNGEHAARNFTFVNGNTAITYQMYAHGAGHWVDPPSIPGIGKVGGGWCAGAAGAWIGIDIYAEYKAGAK